MNLRERFDRNVNKAYFVTQQEKSGVRKKPKKQRGPEYTHPTTYGRMLSRDHRLLIRQAAINQLQMDMTYHKLTTNETNHYIVCPYSYRYRRLKVGRRKMLYAYDIQDRHIKGFAVSRIKKIDILKKRFSPMWEIELFAWFLALSPLFLS